MKSTAFIFLLFWAMGCGKAQKEPTPAESAISHLQKRLGAASHTMTEGEEMYKGQGKKYVLSVQIFGCKGVDLMDASLKPEVKAVAQVLKNSIQGSDRFEKYKFVLHNDPNNPTPSKTGFNIGEKGFSFDPEDLN